MKSISRLTALLVLFGLFLSACGGAAAPPAAAPTAAPAAAEPTAAPAAAPEATAAPAAPPGATRPTGRRAYRRAGRCCQRRENQDHLVDGKCRTAEAGCAEARFRR